MRLRDKFSLLFHGFSDCHQNPWLEFLGGNNDPCLVSKIFSFREVQRFSCSIANYASSFCTRLKNLFTSLTFLATTITRNQLHYNVHESYNSCQCLKGVLPVVMMKPGAWSHIVSRCPLRVKRKYISASPLDTAAYFAWLSILTGNAVIPSFCSNRKQ